LPLDPGFMARSLSFARFGDRCLWYDSGAVTSGMLKPIWDAFSRGNMLESIFAKESPQIRLIPPKPSPWGEGGPAKPGRMRGRFGTQPFLVEKGGSRLSPQRNFSPAPLGNPVAPSSVTFGDSFPPRGSLWVVQPSTKKRPKSGHADGYRISPSTVPLRSTTPKPASGNERPLNQGGGGHPPATLCVRAFSRESLDPPPGTGREPTPQVWICGGPAGTTCRSRHLPPVLTF
jgi:hypothetical protein